MTDQLRAVKITGPLGVIATVCSEVGAARAVAAAQGPAVGIGVDLVGGLQEPRLDRDHQSGPQRQARVRAVPLFGTWGSPCIVRPTPWPPNSVLIL